MRRLRDHQAKGHLVIIASGTFLPSLQLLGQRLEVTHLVGTQIQQRNGHYTGRFIPPIVKGADKASQVQQYLSAQNLNIDWTASYAYGDSYSDHLFMELVGHPVAVHPDADLRKLAEQQNWEILEIS